MNLTNLFSSRGRLDRAYVELEAGMSDMLEEELATSLELPDFPEGMEDLAGPAEAPAFEAEPEPAEPEIVLAEPVDRTTQHTQARMGSFAAYEELYRTAHEDLQALGSTLARVTAAHHQTRDFLNMVHSDIHRANELELANTTLGAENRGLMAQAEQAHRLRGQLEALQEASHRREAKLLQDADQLRVALAAAKLATIDAKTAVATIEAERAELLGSLAAKSSQAERLARENEVLRERQINLSVDLDGSVKKHAEAQRKLDELTAIHANETAQLTETRSRAAAGEKELARLLKQHDALQAKLEEAGDAMRQMETDADDEDKRHRAELQGLRSEVESFKAQLKAAGGAQQDAADEIAALKAKLKDAEADKRIADDKLSALRKEHDADKNELLAAQSDISELNLQQASDKMALDTSQQEIEELQREVAALKTTVKRLTPFERLYKQVKDKKCDQGRKLAG